MSSYDYYTNEFVNDYGSTYDMSYLGKYVETNEDIIINQVENIDFHTALNGETIRDQNGNIYYTSRIVDGLRKDLLDYAIIIDELLSLVGPGRFYNCGSSTSMRRPEPLFVTYDDRNTLAGEYAKEFDYYDKLHCINDAIPQSIFIK